MPGGDEKGPRCGVALRASGGPHSRHTRDGGQPKPRARSRAMPQMSTVPDSGALLADTRATGLGPRGPHRARIPQAGLTPRRIATGPGRRRLARRDPWLPPGWLARDFARRPVATTAELRLVMGMVSA